MDGVDPEGAPLAHFHQLQVDFHQLQGAPFFLPGGGGESAIAVRIGEAVVAGGRCWCLLLAASRPLVEPEIINNYTDAGYYAAHAT
jgi:hypothetical protein